MKLLKIAFILLVTVTIFSCEDDPIVEPVNPDDNCTGSYCKLSFPDSTKVAVRPTQNPALF